MSIAQIAVIQNTLQKTNEWLRDLSQDIGRDEHFSLMTLRVVLHALRDRITVDEATDLGAQLPMLIRGMYYEEYRPPKTPERIRHRQEFLAHIGQELQNRIDPEQAVRAVTRVLWMHVDPGVLEHVRDMMPKDFQDLFPEAA